MGDWVRNVLAIVIALLAAVQGAVAQGTFGALPNPVSSRDLERYSDFLGLSQQQLLAIAHYHNGYLDSFAQLRDRDMQQLLDDVQNLMRDFDFSQRQEVERQVRALNRVMQRVRALDEQLFDEMLEVLTDDQAARLPRVRLMRERARYLTEMTRGIEFLNPAVRVDLSAMLYEMNLAPQVMEIVDPVLETYERRLTAASRRVFEATSNMILDTLKRLEEMGFTEGSPEDPAVAMRLFGAFQEIWGEISADILKQAADLASMQRSTYRSLESLLGYDDARRLREEYFSRVYREAASIGRRAQRQFDAAAELEELTERQRADIRAMAQGHWQSQSRIADQIADLLDQRRRALSIRDIVRPDEDEREQELEELRSRAVSADEAALNSLYSMLGDELAEQVRNGRGRAVGERPAAVQTAAQVQANDTEPGDPFIGVLPLRISTADVRKYAQQIGLDETQQAVMEALHDDYIDHYRQLSEQHFVPLRAAARELAAMRAGVGVVPAEERQRAQEMFALQRKAFAALRQLDNSFFDDVRAIIEPQQVASLERVQLQRERVAYTGGTNQPRNIDWGEVSRFMRQRSSNESYIDLGMLVEQLQMHQELGESGEALLLDYERKVTDLFREQYELQLRMYQQTCTIHPREDRRQFREAMSNIAPTLRRTNRSIAQLNRELLSELASVVTPEAGEHLTYAYRRLAFSDQLDDDLARAETFLASALDLAELSDMQRTKLRDLTLEYRIAYSRVEQRMFELIEALTDASDSETIVMLRNDLDRLRFERDEINQRARRQLGSILSQEQRQQVGMD